MLRRTTPLVIALLLTACGGEDLETSEGLGCSSDMECLTGEVCSYGQCIADEVSVEPGDPADPRGPQPPEGEIDPGSTDPEDPTYGATGEDGESLPSLTVELSWTADADIDLHVVRNAANLCSQADACFYGTPCSVDYFGHQEWDGVEGATEGDPVLAPSVGNQAGTETFTLDLPSLGDEGYSVVASAWSVRAGHSGMIDVVVRVLLDDEVVLTDTRSLGGAGDNREMVALSVNTVLGARELIAAPGSQASPFATAGCLSYVYD
jgi:hypothetical protein